MNWAFLDKIWRPDTYILNGKNSYLHKMTVPNRFIRISPTGKISYSQRLTLIATCKMDLQKFPLDSQTCPLEIGSFGHDASDIVYKVKFWHYVSSEAQSTLILYTNKIKSAIFLIWIGLYLNFRNQQLCVTRSEDFRFLKYYLYYEGFDLLAYHTWM